MTTKSSTRVAAESQTVKATKLVLLNLLYKTPSGGCFVLGGGRRFDSPTLREHDAMHTKLFCKQTFK